MIGQELLTLQDHLSSFRCCLLCSSMINLYLSVQRLVDQYVSFLSFLIWSLRCLPISRVIDILVFVFSVLRFATFNYSFWYTHVYKVSWWHKDIYYRHIMNVKKMLLHDKHVKSSRPKLQWTQTMHPTCQCFFGILIR